jgi:hypothetical protein
MKITFATPLAGLLGLGALVPLVALLLVRRRARRLRAALAIPEPPTRAAVPAILTVLAAGLLLGLAAAQVVVERNTERLVRTDAEAYVVLDVTKSMLARRGLGSPRRIDRAKAVAGALREELEGVPVGIASLADRALPHLFPSHDDVVFHATLERALGVERPPPRASLRSNATRLVAVLDLQRLRFFSPAAKRRVMLVLTDGETQSIGRSAGGARVERDPAGIVFVRFWHPDERVYTGRVAVREYRPDLTSTETLDRLAGALGASVYDEDEVDAAAGRALELLGEGPSAVRGQRRERIELAPYLAGAAFLPLLLALWRRDR